MAALSSPEASRELGPEALSLSAALGAGSGLEAVKTKTLPDAAAYTVVSAEGGDARYSWAVAETRGRRPDMEDAHCVCLDLGPKGGRSIRDSKAHNSSSGGAALFGVFDGHAGREVSAFCAQHMPAALAATPHFQRGDTAGGLSAAFLALDDMMRDPRYREELYAYRKRLDEPPAGPPPEGEKAGGDEGAAGGRSEQQREDEQAEVEEDGRPLDITPGELGPEDLPPAHREAAAKYGRKDEQGRFTGPKAGSTAVVAVVQDGQLLVASAGDSRAVLCVDGKAVPLTQDHKPDLPDEAERIYAAGLFVAARPGGVPRVAGALAMSRAMGDVKYKANPDLPPELQAVTALPDLSRQVDICEDTGSTPLLLLACDGLWDVMGHQEAMDLVLRQLKKGASLRAAVQALVAEAVTGDARGRPSNPKAAKGRLSYDNVTALLVAFH